MTRSKHIVITGAGRGIGAATARQLSSAGHTVVLVSRTQTDLRAVADACGSRARIAVADVSDRAAVERVAQETLDAIGHIDVWVNNAGVGITRLPSELTDDDIDEMMRSNVKSALYGMQAVLPHFKSRGHGQIVNVSSMLGRMPRAVFRSAYVGAKHFLNGLTAVLRDELASSHPGIVVSLVSPGVVQTEFGLRARHGGPDSRTLPGSQTAEAVASVIATVIERGIVDAYTRPGARAMVLDYCASLGEDVAPSTGQ